MILNHRPTIHCPRGGKRICGNELNIYIIQVNGFYIVYICVHRSGKIYGHHFSFLVCYYCLLPMHRHLQNFNLDLLVGSEIQTGNYCAPHITTGYTSSVTHHSLARCTLKPFRSSTDCCAKYCYSFLDFNTMRPRHNDSHSGFVFFKENCLILNQSWLKFFSKGSINNNASSVPMMAWH